MQPDQLITAVRSHLNYEETATHSSWSERFTVEDYAVEVSNSGAKVAPILARDREGWQVTIELVATSQNALRVVASLEARLPRETTETFAAEMAGTEGPLTIQWMDPTVCDSEVTTPLLPIEGGGSVLELPCGTPATPPDASPLPPLRVWILVTPFWSATIPNHDKDHPWRWRPSTPNRVQRAP